MQDFALGVLAGQASIMLTVALLLLSRNPKHSKGIHLRRRPRKIDGIWTVRDEAQPKPQHHKGPRVRKAIILERTRRGYLE